NAQEVLCFPPDFCISTGIILYISNYYALVYEPLGLPSLPGASLRGSRPDVVGDDDEPAKPPCQSGFREPSRNFAYLCWVLPLLRPRLAALRPARPPRVISSDHFVRAR